MAHGLELKEVHLLEELGAGVAVTDGDGLVVRWNANAERILGVAAADAIGHPWSEAFTILRGRDVAGSEIRAGSRRPGGWHGRALILVPGPREVWVHTHVLMTDGPKTDPRPIGIAVFWQASDPATDESRPVTLPYRDLFRVSPEPLVLADLQGLVVDANEAAAALLELTVDSMIGRTFLGYIKGWTDERAAQAREQLREAGSLVQELTLTLPSGHTLEVEGIANLVSPTEGGYMLIRLRDLTRVRGQDDLLRDMAGLARLGDEPIEVQEVAQRVLGIVAGTWNAEASLVLLQHPDGVESIAGPGTSEAIKATFGGTDGARGTLGPSFGELARPVRVEYPDNGPASDGSARIRALGVSALWSTPLWFADRRIGTLVLLWLSDPEPPFDAAQIEQVGRHAGLAIGNADLRDAMRRDAALRATLEGTARVGGVVLSQMAEAILTADQDRRVTALNPAAEQMYGFRAEDAVGRLVSEVLEETELDGSPLPPVMLSTAKSTGYWHGRVIQRPLIGNRVGRNIVADLSLTLLRNERREPAGAVGMAREVSPGSHLDSDAAALSSLAVATGRARTGPEVAASAMERLCEGTMADFGVIALCLDPTGQTVEASRGFSEEVLEWIRAADMPELLAALDEPAAILGVERLDQWNDGPEVAEMLRRNGVANGFLVGLRASDQTFGFVGLGSRSAAWMRPRDEAVLQIAALVANALHNARLMERLEHGLDQEKKLTSQLETLMSLTQLPSGDVDERSVAQLLLDRVVGAIGAVAGFVVREDGDHLRVVASHNMPDPMRTIVETPRAQEHYFWRRLEAVPGSGAFRESLRSLVDSMVGLQPMIDGGIEAHAVFPIREGDRLLGAFVCYFEGSNEAPHEADDRNVEAVGRVISIAYSNVRMSESLAESAEHERSLTAELRALQELTLLGASTDDISRLAQETIESVVVATGASGGGYFLVDETETGIDQVVWVGQPSRRWKADLNPSIPTDWPPFSQLQADQGIWLSKPSDESGDDAVAGSQSVLPLRIDDRLAGVLHLEWAQTAPREQFDVHFLEPIARICSISLANYRLRSELMHRATAQRALGHRLDTLDQLTMIGEEAGSFEELAHRTVSLVREALGAAGVCYLLIEPGHHFETHAVAGETGAFRLWLKGVPAKDAPGGSLLLSGGGSVLGDFIAGQVNERVLPLARATGFRSFASIPIRSGDELAGALLCFFEQSGSLLPLDEAALDSVARIAGIALANFRLRERLVSSEERYRTLFEESPDALLVSALDGTVLDANEAAIKLYRVNRGEILGRYFGQLISADEREMARRRQIVWAQGRGTFRDRGRRPDGSEFPVEVEVRVVELGGQRRFIQLVRDLSDQERLQRELLQAQKMEAIGQLVSGVAHELNNPLAAIIAFSQLLRGDDRLPEDMKHDAGLLVQEADRTRRIVQNLLDFARARQPERRPTSIAVLVQSVLELQSYALNTNQIQVKVDIPPTLPHVDLDRAQLQQVLLNLTINAIQAIRGAGRKSPAHLTISATLVKSRGASAASRNEKVLDDQQRVRISIRDDGPGVPESARARLFDPFFTTKQPGEGTGLGLSVSFGIVAAHDGHLWYEPGPGNAGSTFVIELPVTARAIDERRLTAAFESDAVQTTSGGAPHPGLRRPETAAPAPVRSRSAAGSTSRAEPSEKPGTASEPAPAESTSPVGAPAAAETAATGMPAAPAAPAVKPAPGGETRKPRILVLDDEPSIRVFLTKALKNAGMECAPFADGASAWDSLRSMGDYDVMLIDHRMAGMSGTEFYEAAVQLRPELANRAVFMSGDVLNPDLRGFATQRGIRLLAKPFDIDAVIRIVRESLAASGATSGSPAAAETAPAPTGPAPIERDGAGKAGPRTTRDDAAPGTSDPVPHPPAAARKPRILVLDDEPSIRIFLKKALATAGMDCSPYPEGAAAWEGVRDIPDFDAMLIDHRMAGMSGTEFYEAAIELRPELAQRTIFMSGDVLNPDLRDFAAQRGIRLLAKPFDISAAIEIVKETLAAASAASAAGATKP